MSDQNLSSNGHHTSNADLTTLLAMLPPNVQQALQNQDTAALSRALAELPEAESEQIVNLLEQIGIIRRRPSLEEISAHLPAAVRDALEQQDMTAFNAALDAMPDDDREQIIAMLEDAGYIKAQPPEPDALFAMLPPDVQEAMRNQDIAALQTALDALPPEQQQEAVAILEELQNRAIGNIPVDQLLAELPDAMQDALAQQDSAALQAAFIELDPSEQERVMKILELLQYKQ